ncbi:MAG: hypothetical protein WDA42_03425 [Candidatus Bathyarchaeia archaeon]
MRKILLLIAVMAIGMMATAQIGAVKTLTIATLDTAEVKYSSIATVSGSYNAITFQALCTEIGGQSDGKLNLEASVDGLTYKPVIEKAGAIVGNPVADSLIVEDGAVWQVTLYNAPFKYYRIAGTGTDNDTTAVTIKYILK